MSGSLRRGPAHTKRKEESFARRYGMSRKDWKELKKTDPKEAHLLRMNVQKKDYTPSKVKNVT